MKKGFTLIEVVLAMTITSLMILAISTIILKLSDNYYAQSNVVDFRDDFQLVETFFENEIREANGIITISNSSTGADINGYALTNYSACYYIANGKVVSKNLASSSNYSTVANIPQTLGKTHSMYSINFSKVTNVDNAIKAVFNIQDDEGNVTQHEEIVFSTLNPNVVINLATDSDAGNNMICIKKSSK